LALSISFRNERNGVFTAEQVENAVELARKSAPTRIKPEVVETSKGDASTKRRDK